MQHRLAGKVQGVGAHDRIDDPALLLLLCQGGEEGRNDHLTYAMRLVYTPVFARRVARTC